MRRLKKSIIIFVVAILTSFICNAQSFISGTVTNYTNNEGLITSYDMMSRNKITFGTIDNEGKFIIPLENDFLELMLEKAKKEQIKESNGGKISFNTLTTTFLCDFDNENIEYLEDGSEKANYVGSNKKNEILYKKGETIITGIPDIYLIDKNKVSSILYAVSEAKIANWLFSYRQDSLVKGYYLQWFFVENESSAIGECVIPTYTGNGEESYMNTTIINLKLQKGWNIIKYNITEVFTDINNKAYASETEISNIKEIPNDLKWISVIEK